MSDVSPESPSDGQSAPAASEGNAATKKELKPLRIWPAVILLVSLLALWTVPSFFEEVSFPLMMSRFMGPAACALLILLWWGLFSRASMWERVEGFVGVLAILFLTNMVADKTIKNFGILMFAVPWGFTAFTLVLIVTGRMQSRLRTRLALLAALVGIGVWGTLRNDAIRGDFRSSFSFRWQPTAEDRFLATLAVRSTEPRDADSALAERALEPLAEPEWSEFRGPNRDGVLTGVILHEDWQTQAPQEVWRIQVGPGWSSFSVAGNRLFTQEQRGDNEVVVCYDAQTGSEVWTYETESRFWEAVGGAGPRATPTLADGKMFTMGAEGWLHRLDPLTGEKLWERDLRADADRKPPTWGFSSSPLVLNDVVIVHAGGSDDKGVFAYDLETGDIRWSVPSGDHSYSSPQIADIDGKTYVLMLTNAGLGFIDPESGTLAGDHTWPFNGYRVVQPTRVGPASFLLGTTMGVGTQRVDVSFEGDQFVAEERWISLAMKPYYNDYVAHKGYLYGFDSNIFACIDLETGDRQWKKGRYGNGQVLLLPDGDQLLVISEDGDLVLLRATPEKLDELTRLKVLEGRTWNHPVLIGDRLYVRNGEEAACYVMPVK